jgi:hypothetical protein
VADIRSAQVVLYYLFDVAETVDLQAVPNLIQGPTTAARLAPKTATPAYVQYDKPPLVFDGDAVGLAESNGFRVRFRVYDYGVISVALTRGFSGSWPDLVDAGQSLIENDELERDAERLYRVVLERLRPAMEGLRGLHLSEDYLVYAVHELDEPMTADRLLTTHGAEIAAMLRGERQRLSEQEESRILSNRISYLADDLVIPTWNAAFVYDTPAGAQAALEIVEYANSQLLQYRYYDERLDQELTSIYADLQKPRWYDRWIGSRYERAARRLHALFIDVNEITGRTENALRFTADVYAARLFGLIAGRLVLDAWKGSVAGKLRTLDDIYRFAVEQTSMARGEVLELAIVLILVFELLLFFLGIMQ